ncbi:MAG: hypothetical protein AAF743_05765 [Planctomycetota bacterium]
MHNNGRRDREADFGLGNVADRLVDAAKHDPGLRAAVCDAARQLLDALAFASDPPTREQPSPPEPAVHDEHAPDPAWEAIATRCKLKAEALEWQLERKTLLDAGDRDAVQAGDANLIARAKQHEECFLWMCNEEFHKLREPAEFARAARCYRAVAEAVDVLSVADAAEDGVREAFLLVGEAQSALRVCIDQSGLRNSDPDQREIFRWLRRETKSRQIYVPHMQLKSPADPAEIDDVLDRLAELRQRLTQHRQADKQHDEAVRKVEYHAHKLEAAPDPACEFLRPEWEGLLSALDAARDKGIAADDPALITAIQPVLDLAPIDVNFHAYPGALDVWAKAEERRTDVAGAPA